LISKEFGLLDPSCSTFSFLYFCSCMVFNNSSLFITMSNLIWINITIMDMKRRMLIYILTSMLISKEKKWNNDIKNEIVKFENKIICDWNCPRTARAKPHWMKNYAKSIFQGRPYKRLYKISQVWVPQISCHWIYYLSLFVYLYFASNIVLAMYYLWIHPDYFIDLGLLH
jgi:hypothetical protein